MHSHFLMVSSAIGHGMNHELFEIGDIVSALIRALSVSLSEL